MNTDSWIYVKSLEDKCLQPELLQPLNEVVVSVMVSLLSNKGLFQPAKGEKVRKVCMIYKRSRGEKERRKESDLESSGGT